MHRKERREEELRALAQAALVLVRDRAGRLAALTVRAPPDIDARTFVAEFEGKLAEVGLDFIDVVVEQAPGPPRIVAAEFQAA